MFFPNQVKRKTIQYVTSHQLPLWSAVLLFTEIKEWNEWSNWTSCNEPCGGGLQNRSRSCQNPVKDYVLGNCIGDSIETNDCNTHKCQSR